jgi:hypothetical protein
MGEMVSGAVVIAIGAVILMCFVDVVPAASRTTGAMHMCKRRIQRYALEHDALPAALSQTKEIAGFDNSISDALTFLCGMLK